MRNESLYEELRPAMEKVVDALFAVSENLLRKHGNFIPNGALLACDGTIKHVVATPDTEFSTSAVVLPLLHDSLRQGVRGSDIDATGVAENVSMKLEDQRATEAIKVLFEHRRGLTIALYLPYRKKLLGGYVFGEVISRWAEPEVNAFGSS